MARTRSAPPTDQGEIVTGAAAQPVAGAALQPPPAPPPPPPPGAPGAPPSAPAAAAPAEGTVEAPRPAHVAAGSTFLSAQTPPGFGNTFVLFCSERGLCALPAAPSTLVLYTAWHSERGSVQPQSFQPYLSAINTAHRHVLGEASVPAGGGLLTAVRRGWLREHLARPGVQKDVTMALPAGAARSVLTRLMRQAAAPAEQRAHTFLVLSFATLMRASSAFPLEDADIVDEPAELRVCPRRIKGGQLSALLPIPKVFPAAPGSAYMAQAVRRWRSVRAGAWRAQLHAHAPGPEEPGSFWALPGDDAARGPSASPLSLVTVKEPPAWLSQQYCSSSLCLE